ncbi:MAG TPA: hypothetical protein VHN98_07640 [Acidimicrobiales bacterium]|nr:hypothetical protein [Acidimicrobiales bacterium]
MVRPGDLRSDHLTRRRDGRSGGHFGLLHYPSCWFDDASAAQQDFLVRVLRGGPGQSNDPKGARDDQ